MRIVVNDIAVSPDSGGVYSILQDFYQELIQTNDENEWIFLLSGDYLNETEHIKVIIYPTLKTNWIKRLGFEMFFGRKIINDLQPDVYFSLQNTMTFGIKANKKIAYVHQPLSFQKDIKFSLFKRNERNLAIHQKFIGKFINFSLKRNKPLIIVQTRWMKNAIINLKIAIDSNIRVIKPKEMNKSIKKISNLEREFFFPSIIRTYKNHKVILDAVNKMKESDFNVKFTGYESDLEQYEPIDKKINFIGKINRDDVYEEYTKSVLIFPSLMETYGLPLAEAKSTGTIIFAADLDYAHEVIGKYNNVYYFDPNSSEDLAKLMSDFLQAKITLNINNFEVENNIKKNKDLIDEILN